MTNGFGLQPLGNILQCQNNDVLQSVIARSTIENLARNYNGYKMQQYYYVALAKTSVGIGQIGPEEMKPLS